MMSKKIAVVNFVPLFILVIASVTEAKDLLFLSGNAQETAKRATEESIKQLNYDYDNLLLYAFVSGLLVWLVGIIAEGQKMITRPLKGQVLSNKKSAVSASGQSDKKGRIFLFGRLLVYVLFAIELALLPVKYGQNVYPLDFPRVKIAPDEAVQITLSENIWLIRENPDSFTLYFGDTQEALLVPKSHVLTLPIDSRKNILTGI